LVADQQNGGFGFGEKYPMSPQLISLLRIIQLRPDTWLAQHINRTLQAIADGGLRDHVDGGFFRYTTDRQWSAPHFERMLYDNALLAQVYFLAGDVFDNDHYHAIGREILDFLIRYFKSPEGGFIASLSAVDSTGLDGGFYTLSESEIRELFNASESTAIEKTWQQVAVAHPLEPRYLPSVDVSSNEVMLDRIASVRRNRSLPHDDKRIAGWNGLALTAFSMGAKRSSNTVYRQVADDLYRFLIEQIWVNGNLKRTPSAGQGNLSDYAYIAQGVNEYAGLSRHESAIDTALTIATSAWQLFFVEGVWRSNLQLEMMLPYTVYPAVMEDTALPSASATLVGTTLGLVGEAPEPLQRLSRRAALVVDENVIDSPFFYATHVMNIIGQ
ncbi:MAG: hypothetical protein AAF420_16585, partial [Pseudomonadota bacterium]